MAASVHGKDLEAIITDAAKAVAHDPWAVVQQAGHLARARWIQAPEDLGLTENLRVTQPKHPAAIANVPAGALYPRFDRAGRQRRGAYDTPAVMARRVVDSALSAAARPVLTAVDPAAGTGAFLVALAERGIERIRGIELDPVAAAVANIAAPRASIEVGSGLDLDLETDLLVGNPPFIPPERQDKTLRTHLRQRLPWLSGRFDLAVPFSAIAVAQVRRGGGVGLVLPAAMMVQPYARPLRARWIEAHHIHTLTPESAFPGAQVQVVCISMEVGAGPAPLPDHGLAPESLKTLTGLPLQPMLRPGDPELSAQIRSASYDLGEFSTVDTGVVGHSSGGGKSALLSEHPSSGLVPYVDARDMVENRTRWLDYRPDKMHRAKTPELFNQPKVLVQRLRGRGPIRAWVDRSGLYAGHTLTIVRPDDPRVSPEIIHRLITDPLVDGLLRLEHGPRLDLYPRDVRGIPLPRRWLTEPDLDLQVAWGISRAQANRLLAF